MGKLGNAKGKGVKRGVDDADEKKAMVVRNKNRKLSIECLPSEILVVVFEHLPAADRMRIEQVNKRWKNLANDSSWSRYKIVSDDHFPDFYNWTGSDAKLQALFKRCYRFVEELDFECPSATQTTYDLLSMLTDLKHMDLYLLPMDSARLSHAAELFPNLQSLVFVRHRVEPLDGLMAILARCEKIEMLRLYCSKSYREVREYQFSKLPSALRCVYLHGDFEFSAFLDQIITQKIRLVSLEIVSNTDVVLLSKIDFTRLKYLSFRFNTNHMDDFSGLLWYLSNLHGLKPQISGDLPENCLEELCDSIATRCEKLKHLDLVVWDHSNLLGQGEKEVNSDALVRLTDLPELCSVSVNFCYGNNEILVQDLFDKLVQLGKLQYFRTNGKLEVTSICQAVSSCKGLTQLFCSGFGHKDYTPLLKALDDVHEGEALPIYKKDQRVLHTNFGRCIRGSFPKHPWVRFYSNEWGPVSKIEKQIRYGECSSLPNYLDAYLE